VAKTYDFSDYRHFDDVITGERELKKLGSGAFYIEEWM